MGVINKVGKIGVVNVLGLGIGFLLNIVIAKFFSVYEFANYNLITTYYIVISSVCKLGYDAYVVKYAENNSPQKILGYTQIALLLIVPPFLLIYLIWALNNFYIFGSLLGLASVLFFLFFRCLCEFFGKTFQSIRKYSFSKISFPLLVNLVLLLSFIIALQSSNMFNTFLYMAGILSIAGCLILLGFNIKVFKKIPLSINVHEFKNILSLSKLTYPLMVISILYAFTNKLGIIISDYIFSDFNAIASVSLAYSFSAMITLVFNFFGQIISPLIVSQNAIQKNIKEIKFLLIFSAIVSTLLFFISLILVDKILFLLNPEYARSSLLVIYFLTGAFISSLFGYNAIFLSYNSQNRIVIIALLTSCITFIGMVYCLKSLMNEYAIGIAYIVSMITWNLIVFIEMKRTWGFTFAIWDIKSWSKINR